jgi:hypothetical protein
MSVKIWRFASIYLTAITLSLTFSYLLEMPGKFNYGQASHGRATYAVLSTRKVYSLDFPGRRSKSARVPA